MSLQNDIPIIWDASPDLNLDRYEIWRAPNLAITAVFTGTKKFRVGHAIPSWFQPSDSVVVTGSTGNDGTYTVVAATKDALDTYTDIEVVEAIPSAVADGFIGTALIGQLAGTTTRPAFIDKDMPEGFYFYVVYAVDKLENFSDPSDIALKTSPPDSTAPAMPTGVFARRKTDFTGVELFWNENNEPDLKAYAIFRSIDGGSNYLLVATTAANKYVDNQIPLDVDPASRSTSVSYKIAAFDKSFNTSTLTSATAFFAIPLLQKTRTIIDFLSILTRWEVPLPEDLVEAVMVFLKLSTAVAFTPQGAVSWPSSVFRIDEATANPAIVRDQAYDVALAVVERFAITAIAVGPKTFTVAGDQSSKFTATDLIQVFESTGNDGTYTVVSAVFTTVTTITVVEAIPSAVADGFLANATTAVAQVPILRVDIPDYDEDTTAPNEPALVSFVLEPDRQRAIISWDRLVVDDDFLRYEIHVKEENVAAITPSTERPWLLNGKTGNNNFTLLNPELRVPLGSFEITGHGANVILVVGNFEDHFIDDDIVEIRGSTSNDGDYTVVSSIDSGGNTSITVVESIPVPGTVDGYCARKKLLSVRVYAVDRAGNLSIAAEGIAQWRTVLLEDFLEWLVGFGNFVSQTSTVFESTDSRIWYLTWGDNSRNTFWFKNYMLLIAVDTSALGDKRDAFVSEYWEFGNGVIAGNEVLADPVSNQLTMRLTQAGVGDSTYIWIWSRDEFDGIYPSEEADIIEIVHVP